VRRDPLHGPWSIKAMTGIGGVCMSFQPISIGMGVNWVGVRDSGFQVSGGGPGTPKGTLHNAYLVHGLKLTLVHLVPDTFADQFVEQLRQLVEPEKIKYVVLDSPQVGCGGTLDRILGLAPKAEVLCTRDCAKSLAKVLGRRLRLGKTVTGQIRFILEAAGAGTSEVRMAAFAESDSKDLGGVKLSLLAVPGLGSQEAMVTYVHQARVLMPGVAFGAHVCAEQVFADTVADFSASRRTHYDAFVRPCGEIQVRQALGKLAKAGWEIDVVAPRNGPVHRENAKKLFDEYAVWAAGPG